MNVKPIHDRIFFTFVENLTNNNFLPKTKSGIILTDNLDFSEVHRPQWGKVISVGPKTSDEIRNSTYILIEAGKWTTRIQPVPGGETFWQTEESFILATTDDAESTVRY